MPETITKARLDRVVRLLNQVTGNRFDYSLDSQYGGLRLVRKGQSIDVSPRMTKTELFYWIHAYIEGVYVGKGEIVP